MFKNLRELVLSMPDEKTCRDYLIQQRWNGKPICPFCFSDKVYVIEGGAKFKCAHKECYKKFSVRVGTIFEASNLPLTKWFMAIYLCTAHKKGISSYQLGRDLGIAQKNAWFMLHRIREMMRLKVAPVLSNTVEVDEVYMGGKVKNMSKAKRKFLRENNMTGKTKTAVLGMLEREGNLRLITLTKNAEDKEIAPAVIAGIDPAATLVTDSAAVYGDMKETFEAHEVVNHSADEFVRDKKWHTNSVEGAFSHLKRSIYGIYHQVTPKHLSRYCDETMFRYNLRKMGDTERFTFSLTQLEGRLTYKHLIRTPEAIAEQAAFVRVGVREARPVIQLTKKGEFVARFNSIQEAARMTNNDAAHIHRVLNGKRKSTGGFTWKYE